ncbi:hypothetical protein OSJ77_19930 [Phyllobacterium sp. 0TCS1.6C]|jgi:hypothetical protein|uniref:hypothetical protein n=1 Tax=unclassified Phyllobacterium TaxID=2638441 RepID=UPI002265073E|nr:MULTISPECIES: hypothetical protein [unclassified Phyllobacterium]MCX8282464.1 hypothetical protein [Phyllobacterium sp. 0TCS1.6C]MCX8292556.1 hypothetical protein [Phyllobacterium sp. 0TCS1.6A]
MTEKSNKPDPKNDAKAQFTKTQHGGDNDGVSSANPRVLSGKEDGDATFKSDRKENERDRQAPNK